VAAVAAGRDIPPFKNIPAQLAMNLLAGCWRFREDGFQDEEWKMIAETHKIMHDDTIAIAPTTVRVPVTVGHSESIWLETEAPIGIERARAALSAMPGVVLVDDPAPTEKDRFARTYPTPLAAAGQDPTYVGRLRQDSFNPNALSMFVVADNLRKGAALNAVQIAEELIRRKQV